MNIFNNNDIGFRKKICFNNKNINFLKLKNDMIIYENNKNMLKKIDNLRLSNKVLNIGITGHSEKKLFEFILKIENNLQKDDSINYIKDNYKLENIYSNMDNKNTCIYNNQDISNLYEKYKIFRQLIKKVIYKKLDSILFKVGKENLFFHLGGCNGIDNWVGKWCVEKGIKYNLYLPYIDINEQIGDWDNYQKEEFYEIKNNANEIIFGGSYRKRNDLIVSNSDLIIYFCINNKSGTHYTIEKAKKEKKEIISFID